MTQTETFSVEEVEALAETALDPAILATKMTLATINKKRPALAFHLAECLCAICGARDTKMKPATPNEFHYVMGNLAAMDLEVHGDRRKEGRIDDCLSALAAGTEGQRSAHWERIRRLLTQGRQQGDNHTQSGSVATIDGFKKKGTKRQTNDLRTLVDIIALNTPVGMDLLAEPPFSDRVRTLSIDKPITIGFGEGKDENTMRIATDRRGHSCVTWAMHEEGWREIVQDSMEDGDMAFVGESYPLERWFGRSFPNHMPLPVTMNLGEQPTASWITIARLRGRIALLLRRPRGVMTVEQGDDIWHYDPAAAYEDTFGTTKHTSLKEQLDQLELSDGDDDEDTILES